jgi:hypothetical protein
MADLPQRTCRLIDGHHFEDCPMLSHRFSIVRDHAGLGDGRRNDASPGRGHGHVARSIACAAALLGLAAGAALAQPGQGGSPSERVISERRDTSERTVLDIGGRVIAFEARPVTVTEFTLPFEAGNALLLQDAQQRLRQPDLGPFGAANGAVLHIVSVSGGDRKLAFERARTIRAALVRLGTAEPRGLAAAATGGETASPTVDARIEAITVTVSRLTRASCSACSATTLGTAAMDTGGVGLATMEIGRPETLAAAATAKPAAPTARTADRREPDANLSFTDRPALATSTATAGISQADARALGAVAGAVAAAPPPREAKAPTQQAERRPAAPALAAPVAAPPAVAARIGASKIEAGPRGRVSAEAVKLADLRALGRAGAPGCRPRSIVIDDYLPPQQGWQCGVR